LAGPHYRIDAAHFGEQRLDADGLNPTASSVSAGEWSTFRVDVGVTGVPVAPKLLLPIAVDAEPEPAPISTSNFVAEEPAMTRVIRPEEPEARPERPIPRPVHLTPPFGIVTPELPPVVAPQRGAIRPQLVVDRFLWPEVCDTLYRELHGGPNKCGQWIDFSKHRAVAFAATDPGAGASTALLLAARHRAAGNRATILDANFAHPGLADMLSVVASHGWVAAQRGKLPLEEVLIESNEDQIVLVPLAGCGREKLNLEKSSALTPIMRSLQHLNDLLLVDAGPLDSAATRTAFQSVYEAAELDGVFLICDRRTTTPQEVIGLVRELKSSGIAVLGTIENFCPQGSGV
jgi:Mrp family chromosome partitioning ATPase